MSVRVRFPSEAHESLLEEILRGIFVLYRVLAHWPYNFAQNKSSCRLSEARKTYSARTSSQKRKQQEQQIRQPDVALSQLPCAHWKLSREEQETMMERYTSLHDLKLVTIRHCIWQGTNIKVQMIYHHLLIRSFVYSNSTHIARYGCFEQDVLPLIHESGHHI